MKKVHSSSSELSPFTRETEFSFLSILGTFLSAHQDALRVCELFRNGSHVARIRNQLSIGSAGEVDDAPIDRDRWSRAWWWIRLVDLTENRSEPLVAISNDRAGFWFPFDGAMNHGWECAELGEVQLPVAKRPPLWMRGAQTDEIAIFSFPFRNAGELPEVTLPGQVEFDEQLSAGVSGDIGEPWQFGSKIFQLIDLIEGCRAATRATSQSEKTLFVRQIPQEAQRIAPAFHPCDLLARRVDAKAERLLDQHDCFSCIKSVRQVLEAR